MGIFPVIQLMKDLEEVEENLPIVTWMKKNLKQIQKKLHVEEVGEAQKIVLALHKAKKLQDVVADVERE